MGAIVNIEKNNDRRSKNSEVRFNTHYLELFSLHILIQSDASTDQLPHGVFLVRTTTTLRSKVPKHEQWQCGRSQRERRSIDRWFATKVPAIGIEFRPVMQLCSGMGSNRFKVRLTFADRQPIDLRVRNLNFGTFLLTCPLLKCHWIQLHLVAKRLMVRCSCPFAPFSFP